LNRKLGILLIVAVIGAIALVAILMLEPVAVTPQADSKHEAIVTVVPPTSLVAGATITASRAPVVISLPTFAPPSVETITLPPGASHIGTDRVPAGHDHGLVFLVDSDVASIASFYSDLLIHDGWKLEWAQDSGANVNGQPVGADYVYTWTDPTRKLPWDLYMHINLDRVTELVPGNWVTITIDRMPSYANIIRYPGAREVEVMWQPSKRWQRFDEQHVSYVTDASNEELTAFYADVLPQFGWSARSEHDDITTTGLLYCWSILSYGYEPTYCVAITGTPSADGSTQVQILVDGTILHP
jgi:hypothetical protein